MRQILLISIISIHLLGNTEISQVFKLPNLIEHYFEHHRQNNDLGFFQFLAMHYGGDDGTDADDDKDSQLPCHNIHHNTLSVVCFHIAPGVPFLDIVTNYNTKEYGKPLLTYLPQKHGLSLFRPPQVA
jgi:hypothetical protein